MVPAPPEERARLRASLGLDEDTFTLGILARLEEYKGHVYLAQAARILKEQGRKFRILAAGTGAFEAELRKAVAEEGVEDVMSLLGFRSDVAALLSILDVQLNASYGTRGHQYGPSGGDEPGAALHRQRLRGQPLAGEGRGQRTDLPQPGPARPWPSASPG